MEFPNVPDGSFLVLLAESATGLILNKDLNPNTSGSILDSFYVFENEDKALVFSCESIETSETQIEAMIYDSNENFIKQID